MLYAGSRERVENYPQVAYFLFSLFSSPLWLCSLKKKHKHPVLVRPIKIMGRRGRSNVHLVVIDYGHLVRQQPFHIMSDHKTPPKSCLCVVGCVCAGEAGLAGTAAHRPRQKQHPPCSCHRLHTMFPRGAQCKDVSGCQPICPRRGGKISHRVRGHLAFCIGAALGLGVRSKQLWPNSPRCLEVP